MVKQADVGNAQNGNQIGEGDHVVNDGVGRAGEGDSNTRGAANGGAKD